MGLPTRLDVWLGPPNILTLRWCVTCGNSLRACPRCWPLPAQSGANEDPPGSGLNTGRYLGLGWEEKRLGLAWWGTGGWRLSQLCNFSRKQLWCKGSHMQGDHRLEHLSTSCTVMGTWQWTRACHRILCKETWLVNIHSVSATLTQTHSPEHLN